MNTTTIPLKIRQLSPRSYWVTGPSGYMKSRGIRFLHSISQGELSAEFKADIETLGGRLRALETWLVKDWSDFPGDSGGFSGTTVIFPTIGDDSEYTRIPDCRYDR